MSNGENIKTLYLPETMANWPWKRAINPHYEAVLVETYAWFEGFKAFTPKFLEAWKKSDIPHLQTSCDLLCLFFILDESTDFQSASVVRQMGDVVIDALNNPQKPRPEGELVLGEIARQFWERGMRTATPTAQKHMVESFVAYLESVVQQAADRDNSSIRTVDSYLSNRRDNIGARPCFAILELDLNLVDDVFYHPVIVELSGYCVDLITLDNDIASYSKEQAIGDDRHNLLTIAMHQFDIELDDAMKWAVSYHTQVQTKFLDGLKRLPSWDPEMDRQIQQYFHGVAHWPRGNYCWNFESSRYFGSKGREIQKHRMIPLYPKGVSLIQDTQQGLAHFLWEKS
ncbi:hypothetical protein M422DRAFT_184320 [Sphaerobolus stellatus SS14]|uniref:Terpene synthase n=1 Tax=Sphaerobolus stellatus (strain SS14) TaxID=990650 RepID=A0A0C9UCV1_SPHS4|nr:hypothetical protein M422DRAFT_184320 [Sphaerobolus stellatus SS14]